ncbi:Uu.00g007510.m01.CDS01 [Anthostomella pinea]|uniref:Uu.00g007510.m01.CDS01 n=1 Tax=Anthostomella pinea TaxID=933095 RepID=A0AAI8YMF2_9PEZI|nr:Uu.00g007510.m01.CDS01 [Anthostomella pinea]
MSKFSEPFILLGVGLAVIGLRTYARAKAVGIKNFMADDYLMLIAVLPYVVEIVLAYIVVVRWKALANNSMTGAHRATLDPHGEEHMLRVNGSKASVAYWVIYTLILWIMKFAMLVFCLRLTERLGKYRRRIQFGFLFVGITWMIVFCCIMLSCRPLNRYWQMYPDPGVVSPINLFVTLSLNVATDIYILGIPLPILWMANIKIWKKLGLITLVSGSIFVITVASIRCYLIFSNTRTGARQAGPWTVRSTFVSIVTTNLPLLFPLFRRWMTPALHLFFGRRWSEENMRSLRTITTLVEEPIVTGQLHDNAPHSRSADSPTAMVIIPVKSVEDVDVEDIPLDISSISEASGGSGAGSVANMV